MTHQGLAATDIPVVRPLSSNRWTASALLVLTAIFVVLAAGYTLGDDGVRHGLNVGVFDNVMIAAGALCVARGVWLKDERLAWILLGSAVIAWGAADTLWEFTVSNDPSPPFPSYADIGFLAVYPLAYAAIVLLLRSRAGGLRSSLWLDGVIGGLAVAAVGSAVVFQAVLNTLGGPPSAVATNLAYPLADLTLIAIVVWALGVTGWRPGRTWGLIAAGLLVFSLSDCLYLYKTAIGSLFGRLSLRPRVGRRRSAARLGGLAATSRAAPDGNPRLVASHRSGRLRLCSASACSSTTTSAP